MAYSVKERRREIGIRMALVARRAAVLRAMVARGVALAVWRLVLQWPWY
ncbi:MAG TPA: hypothetical protein VNH83_21900 [Bryobacteraceae bacterium]|nr:hypothetical protein [Bryobacteraceae bacterium]